MAQTVVGLFNSASEAQQAVQQLTSAGFNRDTIDLSSQQQATAASGTAPKVASEVEDSVGNFFSSLFGGNDNDDARAYTNVARGGSSVVTVHAASANEAERARDLLDQYGAMDVHEEAAAKGYGMTGAQGYTADNRANTNTNVEGGQKLNIIEENLQVGKRVEQTGGARIRTRIIERPVEESVRLREEHVNVVRSDVNRPATEADFAAFKEGEISMTESAERAVVSKEARVVGEVNIGKTATERVETIHDTVRKTDVEVENLGAAQKNTGDNSAARTNTNDKKDGTNAGR